MTEQEQYGAAPEPGLPAGTADGRGGEPAQAPDETHHSVLAILDAIGCGALILDGQGRVLQTNDKAQRYLGAELVLQSRKGAPSPRALTNHSVQVALRSALRTATKIIPQLSHIVAVPRGAGRPLLLRSIRFADRADASAGTAALIVLDLEDFPEPDEDTLRELFLLTPAEIRLAKRLSRGESLTMVGERLGVGVSTLRGQLKSLFWKTGTSRQAELVALLSNVSRLNRTEAAPGKKGG